MRLSLDFIVYIVLFGYVYIGWFSFMINNIHHIIDQLEKKGREEEGQTQLAGSVTQLA